MYNKRACSHTILLLSILLLFACGTKPDVVAIPPSSEFIQRRPSFETMLPWSIEKMLPWPPPVASSRVVLRRELLIQGQSPPATLGEVDALLQRALEGAGYFGSGYWQVPAGFAIVTPLEQTTADGVPLPENLRWHTSIVTMRYFSLLEYIRALLTAPHGHFRVLVFVISSEPFSARPQQGTLATIERWARDGTDVLPQAIGAAEFSNAHKVTVLVYEFVKRRETDQPTTVVPGTLTARDHLYRANLTALVGG